MEIVYRPVIAILRASAAAKGQRLVIQGAEHVPGDGPVVVAGNHVSEYDPIVVGLALNTLGRRGRFLAKQELFETPVLGWMLRDAKQVPVDRAGQPSAALPHALLLLDAGETVALFPEGTISTSFVPAEPKHGAARLALASGAPLLPFATWGGQRVGNPEHPPSRNDAIVLVTRFGPAVPHEPGEPVEAVTDRLWRAVTELVDDVQRSYPQQPYDHADRWWQPQHLGGTAPSVEEAAEERRRKSVARAERAARRQGTTRGGRG
jgi:1-acyl-sn-glycerol-3-phosphate acyltransferase